VSGSGFGRRARSPAHHLDGADVVVNLAGRNVNRRYTRANREQIMQSRIDLTRAVGRAIEQASSAPSVWLQSSPATIYAHRFDAPNDEETGVIGGNEPGVPNSWGNSVEVAKVSVGCLCGLNAYSLAGH